MPSSPSFHLHLPGFKVNPNFVHSSLVTSLWMAQHSLFEFLTRTEIPRIPLRAGVQPTRNTRTDAYPPDSVDPAPWNNFFTYHTIMRSQYAASLGVNVTKDPVNSPPTAVVGERSVQARLGDYVHRRMWRALANTPYPPGHTQMCMETGDLADFEFSNALPDFVGHTIPGEPVICLPGDVKCSWKWKSSWKNSQVRYEHLEFIAVVAQLNFYMNHAHSWYGYILTDTELVLFRKDDQYARDIEMAPGIPLTQHDSSGRFTHTSGHLTALLALWYVHMLASNDQTWSVDGTRSDPEDEDPSGDFQPE